MAPSKSTLLPLLGALPYASAWGSLGHTTVAYIAQNFVCDKTAKFAQSILNDSSTAYLANVATWADSYRYTAEGEFSALLHYIDALDNPPESCNVVYERDCPEEGCIVSAIANYSSRAVQKKLGIVEQQKALKWVIHFLGDIHQPLHVENLAIGGNTINVTFAGVKTNLHAIWDTNIPQKARGNFSQAASLAWATNLTTEIKHGKYKKESKVWLKGMNVKDAVDSAMVWANDANQYVCSTVLPNGTDVLFGQELSGAYYETAIPVVYKQIAKAGYRLAAWLDAIVEAAEKGGHGPGKGSKYDKRGDFELEPWMQASREARMAFGGDCGCSAEEHTH
ncbi:hypothetical protein N0V83_007528 [Neocucurbitaria cava]|uniref:Uncharacterized protein n=1 Tax=Neocucurbitaria cava TaxID=798079 RepID=A0A9W9CKH5_9PLEO|nr:hypothetical protein N0V83_007528 [Neocucurbitaria cava]